VLRGRSEFRPGKYEANKPPTNPDCDAAAATKPAAAEFLPVQQLRHQQMLTRTRHRSALDKRREVRSSRRVAMAALAGAVIGGLAVYWNRRAKQAERENPPMGQFVSTREGPLHFIEQGSGEPSIVLLHGNGTMIEDFLASGVVDRLARSNRVVLFDRPGYGHSPRRRGRIWTARRHARVLEEAFARLGLVRPVVVGHSWATLVALVLGLDSPRRIRSLVLLSGYYNPTFRFDVLFLSPPGLPIIGPLLRWSVSPLIARIIYPAVLRRVFAPGRVSERFLAAFPRELALRPSQLAASGGATGLMIPSAALLRRRYNRLAVPAFVVAGTDDRIVDPVRQSVRLAREIPNGRLYLLPGCGHMLHHQAPDTVAGIIERASAIG
jgi:pimeloyl-ACP methyl ester carboxylesterase